MEIQEWKEATLRAINSVHQYFKPKEVQTLLSFVSTVNRHDINDKSDAVKEANEHSGREATE